MISLKAIRKLCSALYLKANFCLPQPVLKALRAASLKESDPLAREALETIIKNAQLAFCKKLPICQDTGMAVVFLDLGRGIKIPLAQIKNAVENGIKEATLKGYLRHSLIADPIRRKDILPNIPAFFHINSYANKGLRLTIMAKGCGAENWTLLTFLKPHSAQLEIKELVIQHIKNVKDKACPPYIIGIGIGGNADYALYLARKATITAFSSRNSEEKLKDLEKKLLNEINALSIGALGLGGKFTALAVKILTAPTHIASMPLAISLSCHALRYAKGYLK